MSKPRIRAKGQPSPSKPQAAEPIFSNPLKIGNMEVSFEVIHGRQFMRQHGDWQEFSCLRHEGANNTARIAITDQLTIVEQLHLAAEQVLLILADQKAEPQRSSD